MSINGRHSENPHTGITGPLWQQIMDAEKQAKWRHYKVRQQWQRLENRMALTELRIEHAQDVRNQYVDYLKEKYPNWRPNLTTYSSKEQQTRNTTTNRKQHFEGSILDQLSTSKYWPNLGVSETLLGRIHARPFPPKDDDTRAANQAQRDIDAIKKRLDSVVTELRYTDKELRTPTNQNQRELPTPSLLHSTAIYSNTRSPLPNSTTIDATRSPPPNCTTSDSFTAQPTNIAEIKNEEEVVPVVVSPDVVPAYMASQQKPDFESPQREESPVKLIEQPPPAVRFNFSATADQPSLATEGTLQQLQVDEPPLDVRAELFPQQQTAAAVVPKPETILTPSAEPLLAEKTPTPFSAIFGPTSKATAATASGPSGGYESLLGIASHRVDNESDSSDTDSVEGKIFGSAKSPKTVATSDTSKGGGAKSATSATTTTTERPSSAKEDLLSKLGLGVSTATMGKKKLPAFMKSVDGSSDEADEMKKGGAKTNVDSDEDFFG